MAGNFEDNPFDKFNNPGTYSPDTSGMSIAAFVIGVIGIICSCLFTCGGLVFGIIGLILANIGLDNSDTDFAKAAQILNIVAIVLSGVLIFISLIVS